MRYEVHISDADRQYLDNLPLSDRAKEKVEDFLDYAIAQVDDAFRNDPANRPQSGNPYFQRDFLLLDVDAAGNTSYHQIVFVVRDDKAAFGILLLVYVEHHQV